MGNNSDEQPQGSKEFQVESPIQISKNQDKFGFKVLLCLILFTAIGFIFFIFKPDSLQDLSEGEVVESTYTTETERHDVAHLKASEGTVSADRASAWFLNQLTLEEYEDLRDTLSFSGFLYIGWTDCSYCIEFAEVFQEVLSELNMLDDVRSWDFTMYWEGERSEIVKQMLGVDVVPALLYFTPSGSIKHLVMDLNKMDVEVIKSFLESNSIEGSAVLVE